MYKIVIVDDEEKILDGIVSLFPWNNIGFEISAKFTRAADALSYCKDCKEQDIDVVMTDISMPDMTGIELAQKIKEEKEVIIVFFSSYQDYTYMREAIHQGIEDYLLKPIRYEDLVNCFEKIRERLDSVYGTSEEKPKTYYEEIITKVDQYLEETYQRATLAGAAELVGLSTNYLSKIYKEKNGVGFAEQLNRIRMEKACELLSNPEYKGYEIAFLVGYDNPKNFTRAFKMYFQVSPREYRNGVRKES